MTKKLINIPATASIKLIPKTRYVLIDGKHIAKLLTPTYKAEQPHFNLFLVKGKNYKSLHIDDVVKLFDDSATAAK